MPNRITEELSKKCKNIAEALPYIQKFSGNVIVIKYGGSAMLDPALRTSILTDILLMKEVGMLPVLVHGGGKEISRMMDRMKKKAEFIQGLRVTDRETMDIVEMVLVGKVNKELVGLLNSQGGRAVGVSGKDDRMIQAVKHEPVFNHLPEGSQKVDLGYVGKIKSIRPDIIFHLQSGGFIPVIAPTSLDENGKTLNVNGDLAAAEIAAALHARKLIFLTDQRGVLKDANDPKSLISEMKIKDIPGYVGTGVLRGGMLPKTEASARALEQGVKKIHIVDGRIDHSILLEIFTDSGIGTMITA